MDDCPTANQWRAHAASARALGNEYLAEGKEAEAQCRFDRADFYEQQAVAEEWLLSSREPITLGEAA